MRIGTTLSLLALPLLAACTVNATSAPGEPSSATPEAPAAVPETPAAPTAAAPTAAPTPAADPKPADMPTSEKPAALPASPVTPVATNAAPASPVVGGYTAADPASASVQSAAAEAVKLLQLRTKDRTLALGKVRGAQTQVVAGTNYRLELDVRTGGATKPVTVVLYKNLQGGAELTSVEGL
jgi:hypothetical protein